MVSEAEVRLSLQRMFSYVLQFRTFGSLHCSFCVRRSYMYSNPLRACCVLINCKTWNRSCEIVHHVLIVAQPMQFLEFPSSRTALLQSHKKHNDRHFYTIKQMWECVFWFMLNLNNRTCRAALCDCFCIVLLPNAITSTIKPLGYIYYICLSNIYLVSK